MTKLLIQAQGVFGSFFLGMVFLFSWSIFNRAFYKWQGKLFRLPFEIVFFMGWAGLYFLFLVTFTKGVYNIFYFLSFAFGAFIYYRFYHPRFLVVLEGLYEALAKLIVRPIKLKIRTFCAKIKKNRKEKKPKHERSPIQDQKPSAQSDLDHSRLSFCRRLFHSHRQVRSGKDIQPETPRDKGRN